jgi:cell division protein FtsA
VSRPSYLAALDVGTSKVAATIAEIAPDRDFVVSGVGLAETTGVRRGVVVDLPAASRSIIKAIAEAELMAGMRIDRVHVGLSGSHATGFNSRGIVSIAGHDHAVTAADVARAVDAATGVSLPDGREMIHVLPQDFVVDGEPGIANPIGMTGMRLEANVYVVTANVLRAQNVIDAVNRVGVAVEDFCLDSLATSEAIVTEDERALGVALVDIGAGTTSYATFEHGSLARSGSVAIGGDHFTTAAAVGLRTPLPDAEKLKRRYGWAVPTCVDDVEMIDVSSLGGRPRRQMPQRALSDLLEREACRLFQALYREICDRGIGDALAAGVVITGGGSILGGMTRVAERVFQMPVRRGSPVGIGGLTDHINAPALATAVGLLLHAHRHPTLAPLTQAAAPVGRLFRGLFSAGRMAKRAS